MSALGGLLAAVLLFLCEHLNGYEPSRLIVLSDAPILRLSHHPSDTEDELKFRMLGMTCRIFEVLLLMLLAIQDP